MQAHLRLEQPSQSRAFREGFLLYTRNSSTKTTHDVAALTTGRARSVAGLLISVIPWWLDARSKLSPSEAHEIYSTRAHHNSIFAPVPIRPPAPRRTGSSQRKFRSARQRSSGCLSSAHSGLGHSAGLR